jgi:hypothetical protein
MASTKTSARTPVTVTAMKLSTSIVAQTLLVPVPMRMYASETAVVDKDQQRSWDG